MTREEIELQFIRAFQFGGLHLGTAVSIAEKQHRVRLAIWREGFADKLFPGMTYTWAEAYRLWSGKSLEQRAKPRPSKQSPEDHDHGRDDDHDERHSDAGTIAEGGDTDSWDDESTAESEPNAGQKP